MKEIDIYRSAKLLIQQVGKDAQSEALANMSAFYNKGDFEGALVWTSIAKAIKELERADLKQSSIIH